MKIRQYHPSDRKDCIELFKSNMPLFFAATELPDFEVWLDALDAKKLAYKQTEKEYYYVVEHHNKIVACGGFYISKKAQNATMAWGMVHYLHHKKGIGRKLLVFRIQEIKKLYSKAVISLDTTQYSFHFFEKVGFAVTKITNDFYMKGMHRYDMINHNK